VKLQKHWYLGFLGLVGFYELPDILEAFRGSGSPWNLAGLLWFLWFLNFLPAAVGRSKT